jgi:hypothetical protein
LNTLLLRVAQVVLLTWAVVAVLADLEQVLGSL